MHVCFTVTPDIFVVVIGYLVVGLPIAFLTADKDYVAWPPGVVGLAYFLWPIFVFIFLGLIMWKLLSCFGRLFQ